MIEITPTVFLAIATVVLLQSVFGVGILLFGTPILLFLGYDFVSVLSVLLPLSILINSLQILRHRRYIDLVLYRRMLLYTMPWVVAGLLLVTMVHFSMGFLVGGFLVLLALKSVSARLDRGMQKLVAHERWFMTIMGLVHGTTNLGGSLLTAFIHTKQYDKDTARATTAMAYCTFALGQLGTLVLSPAGVKAPLGPELLLAGIATALFFMVEKMFYAKLESGLYRRALAGLVLATGLLLIARELLA